jgi:hypothetical protein
LTTKTGKVSLSGIRSYLLSLFSGFADIFRYLFNSKATAFINPGMISTHNLLLMVFVLGIIGVLRNIIEILVGGSWALQWFSWNTDVMFTMFFYPIFLCLFTAALMHFFLKIFKIRVRFSQLLSILFFLQVIHLAVPFIDSIGELLHLPYHFIIPASAYAKLIFTPLAWTPLIILFTWPTSFGIDVAWVFASAFFLKLFLKHFRLGAKAIIPLIISFYIVYLSIYPVYYFFINENIIGSNFMFGLLFLLLSIPSFIYARSWLEIEERPLRAHYGSE